MFKSIWTCQANWWSDLKYTNGLLSGHYQGATITSKTIPSVSPLIKHTIEENNKYVPPEWLNWKDATGVSYCTWQPSDEEALHLSVPWEWICDTFTVDQDHVNVCFLSRNKWLDRIHYYVSSYPWIVLDFSSLTHLEPRSTVWATGMLMTIYPVDCVKVTRLLSSPILH